MQTSGKFGLYRIDTFILKEDMKVLENIGCMQNEKTNFWKF